MMLRYRAEAVADLQKIRDYIAHDDPAAARSVVQRIEQSIDRLRTLPWSGRPGASGTRILVVPGLPYVAIYRVGEDGVEIVAVFHTARNRRM
ncbi:type II toxin-antitoxin system RelE/ParE family toxin [Rhodovulum sp. PH10]|uniref:type II toxin-antitoxin system RelE/ParE family toxin n=1 Tax=Rhodovulum sp. PH10 TaxID=1187851 RepID=UPI00030D3A40|nr:type II toxin-antitoxin system RelE/ParE family toxin [Rhodovulum sp. PH10]